MFLSPLTSTTRKLLVASAVAVALGVAAPVQAAETVQFGFSFGNGSNGLSFSLGNGGYNGRHFTPPAPRPVCLSNDQVRSQLRAQGYRWISFGHDFRGWVHTTARQSGRAYEFDVNRCTGAIANMVARGGLPQGGFDQGGFGGYPPGGFNGGFGGGFAGFGR